MSATKSFSTETSERYSRALFEISRDSNELEKVEIDIENFQSILSSSSDIKNFIKDPTHSKDQQNKVINFISEKFGFSNNLRKFFVLI